MLAGLVSPQVGCTSPSLSYSALEPYPTVEQLVATHGQPDEELVWSRDDWTKASCEAGTARVLVYYANRGLIGGLIQRWFNGSIDLVCVDRDGRVSDILHYEY
ncbi:MAG: hypothetical protein KA371_13810 [Acidobacteria bacterium]|nr:hypothetical protein [Acidobacteriota bacterium]